jgi:hypothetical protein
MKTSSWLSGHHRTFPALKRMNDEISLILLMPYPSYGFEAVETADDAGICEHGHAGLSHGMAQGALKASTRPWVVVLHMQWMKRLIHCRQQEYRTLRGRRCPTITKFSQGVVAPGCMTPA